MKRYLIYIYVLAGGLLAAACTQEEEAAQPATSTGHLLVLPIDIETAVDVQPLKRSVDDGLQVDLLQGSTTVRTYAPGDAALDQPLTLPVGNYTLYAHTPDMNEAADNVQGTPTYSVRQDFQIQADETTTLRLEATQSNVGILLDYSDELFGTAFTSIACTLTSPSTGRSVTIEGTDNMAPTYFNLPADGRLEYTISATNTDGETFTSPVREITTDTPKNYLIQIDWAE